MGALAAGYLLAFVLLDCFSREIERFVAVVAFFPSDGLALGAAYVFGWRAIPLVFAGYAFSTTVIYGFANVPLMIAASAVGAGLHGSGGLLLRRWIGRQLDRGRMRDLARFLMAVALVTAAGACIITGTLVLSGDVPRERGVTVLYTATTGLAIGLLMMTTPLALAARPLRRWVRGEDLGLVRGLISQRQRLARDALLLLGTTALTVTVAFSDAARGLDPLYLCFLPIILLALRRGLPGAAVALVVVDTAVVLAFQQRGLPAAALDKIQLLQLALSLTGLVLGTVVGARERAEAAARQAGVLERELEMARRIQTGVLPRVTALPGFDIAGSLETASRVGGDFYDVVSTSSQRFWVMIGDVSGHGMDAGLVMLMAQSAAQASLRSRPDAGPAHLVAQVNRVIYENVHARMGRDDFVTFMALRHDGGGRFLAAGGHLPVYIARADGEVTAVEVTGPWCGVQPEIEGQLRELPLSLGEGDLLCLVTDGVLEARDRNGAFFNEDRLLSALAAARGGTAAQALDQLLGQVRAFQRAQEDDITAVLVKRTGG
jgi:serine phosphatase RsbU (regulator of sigma subunit)/integral membrane sensor domain MASE1